MAPISLFVAFFSATCYTVHQGFCIETDQNISLDKRWTLWGDLGGLYYVKWSEIGSQDVVSRGK